MAWFHSLLSYSIFVVDFVGYLVIITSVLYSLYEFAVVDRFNMHLFYHNTTLMHGIAIALELLMAAEVLKTMLAIHLSDVLLLSVLIVLRVFLGYTVRKNHVDEEYVNKLKQRHHIRKEILDHQKRLREEQNRSRTTEEERYEED